MLIYVALYRPMASKFANNMETFNEVTNVILMYHMQCFSEFVSDAQMRSNIGISFIIFMSLNLAVHLYFLGRDFCHKLKGRCCKKCVESKRKKEQDALAKVKAESRSATYAIPV